MENVIGFVSVLVTLLPKQRVENKTSEWECTINGEKRYVTHNKVQCMAGSLEGAIKIFDEREIESISITADYGDKVLKRRLSL